MLNLSLQLCEICKVNQRKIPSVCSEECKKTNSKKSHQFTCQYCGQVAYSLQKGRKFHDRACSGKHRSEFYRGPNCPNWVDGYYLDSDGYWRVYCPEHPRAPQKRPYVLVHILIMERSIGRLIRPDEIVHHINFIKDYNRIDNLQLMLKVDHDKLHGAIRTQENINGNLHPTWEFILFPEGEYRPSYLSFYPIASGS